MAGFRLAGRLLAVATVAAVAGCGGGGGDATFESRFLTADPRGLSGSVGPGGAGLESPGAPAFDGASEVAREVEEADVVRAEGDRLYLLNPWRGLAVVGLDPPAVLGRAPLAGLPHELYVQGPRVLALVSAFDGQASLVEVSVADPASPTETTRHALGTGFRASRLVGDVLLVVTESRALSFDVSGPAVTPVDAVDLPHAASFVHATDRVLVAAGFGDGSSTPVALLDASDPGGDLVLGGTASIPGWLEDDTKLDVRGDVLRAVTHDFTDTVLSRVTTVDVSDLAAPTPLGSLVLAPGERLFGTRFTDDAVYVVTFEQVDPLWVVDLRDPAHPSVSGHLVVPGWSTHLVDAGGGRLVAVGVDPADGWKTTASLFDVSDPANPALLDRADVGAVSSIAHFERRALGVFAPEGVVTIPVSGEGDAVAVLALGASTLDLRGFVDVSGSALRGLLHPRGLVAVSTEEVVLADLASLAVLGRCTVAEDVVDACRLPDGTLLPLVATGRSARLGDTPLPLSPESLHPFGENVAVLGWDDLGRAAYVVSHAGPSPVVSERFDLGSSGGAMPPFPVAFDAPTIAGGFASSSDARMTDEGVLVVRAFAGWWWAPPGGGGGGGGGREVVPLGPPAPGPTSDGFVVLDVAAAASLPRVDVAGVVSGFALDGDDLVYTTADEAGPDGAGRPRVAHALVRLDLPTRAASAPTNVPGYVLAVVDGVVVTAEETWTEGWSWSCDVVACAVDEAGAVEVLDREPLPQGAHDLRAAGATLWFSAFDASSPPGPALPPAGGVAWAEPGLWLPTSDVGCVRLGASLSRGPTIGGAFRSILLAEEETVLLVRDGVVVERFDLEGVAATPVWSHDAGAFARAARRDLDGASHLVALGHGGLVVLP
jgi:hypothetical protein